MQKILILGILTSMLLISCSKDDKDTPVIADFTATVTGESPNALIEITNNSTGAAVYTWTLSEGASILTSALENPGEITVDKAGDLTIVLVARNGSEEDEMTKVVAVTGYSAIVTYTDVEFALDAGNATYGRLFSFETGEIYLDNEITATNGPLMHLAFGSLDNTMYYFESPSVVAYNVPGATVTKVNNYQVTPDITTVEFDAMTDDRDLSGLTIVETEESFGNANIPGTVLFEISTGRKGVIKTKSVNASRLLADIKVQKY